MSRTGLPLRSVRRARTIGTSVGAARAWWAMKSRTGCTWSCCTLMMKRFGAFSASDNCQRSSRSVRTKVSSSRAINPRPNAETCAMLVPARRLTFANP